MVGNKVISEGEWLSLNGSTGEVILGKEPLSPPALSRDLEVFMSWADSIRKLKVLQVDLIFLNALHLTLDLVITTNVQYSIKVMHG